MNHPIVGEYRTTFPKLKSSIYWKNNIWKLTVTEEISLTVDYETVLIGQTTANQQCEKIMGEHMTIEEDSTTLDTTALLYACLHIFKAKASHK